MNRHRLPPRPRATPEKLGEVFLSPHNGTTPGTAIQADDPRITAVGAVPVPTSRTIFTTFPLLANGAASANLSADITLSVSAAPFTATRVLFAGASGEITHDAGLTYASATDALTVVGRATIGTATDAAAGGDFVAGFVGASRLFFDQSEQRLSLYDSSGNEDLKLNVAGNSWYNGSGNFGFGTVTPDQAVEIVDGGGVQLRLTENRSLNYRCDFRVSGGGNLLITPWSGVINMTTSSSTGGGPIEILMYNDDPSGGNTQLNLGVGTVGDPKVIFDIDSGTTRWSIGAANSDSAKFKISQDDDLGTNDRLTMTTLGYTTLTPGVSSSGTAHGLQVTGAINTGGTNGLFKILGAASTGQTASTEIKLLDIDLSAIVTWATGALTNERAVSFSAPTLAFAGASTVTNAATVYIDRAPQAGTNATITNAYALWVDAGAVRFDGNVLLNTFTAGSVLFAGASGLISQDNAAFFFNDTENALTVGSARLFTRGSQNLFLGQTSGNFTQTGTDNTGVGFEALTSLTDGNFNTALGVSALRNNTGGLENTALGLEAMLNNSTGNYGTCVGFQSMRANTTGGDNVAIGLQSLNKNTTGSRNTALGFQSVFENTTADENLGVGYQALHKNTTGTPNLAVGYTALFNVTTGTHNVGIGYRAGDAITDGFQNVVIGTDAGGALTSARDSVAVGYLALDAASTAGFCVAIGSGALGGVTTGSGENIGIGLNAGDTITTGSTCVFLGSDADATSATLTNAIAIGAGATVGTSNTVVLGNSSVTTTILRANVGIGTTGPDRPLDVLSTAGPQVRLTYTDGSVYGDLETDSAGRLVLSTTSSTTALRLTSGRLDIANVGTDAKISFERTGGETRQIIHDTGAWYIYNAADGRFDVTISNAGLTSFALGVKVGTDLEIDGALNHDGSTVGFFGATPTTQQTYTITNVTTDRAYDANSTSLDEIADTLGTLIADLRLLGLVL